MLLSLLKVTMPMMRCKRTSMPLLLLQKLRMLHKTLLLRMLSLPTLLLTLPNLLLALLLTLRCKKQSTRMPLLMLTLSLLTLPLTLQNLLQALLKMRCCSD